MAVDGEAGALRLGDLDRLDVVAQPVERGHVARLDDELGRVVARLRRQRHDAVVLDVDDLHRVEVDHHDEPLDRAGVAVVVGLAADERQGLDQAPAGRALGVVAGGPGVEHGEAGVVDAALAHRLLPARVLASDLLGGEELLEHDARLHAGPRRPGQDGLVAQAEHHLDRAGAGAVVEDDGGLPVAHRAGEHLLLRRLAELDLHEPDRRPELGVRADDGGSGADLRRGEGFQGGSADHGVRGVLELRHGSPPAGYARSWPRWGSRPGGTRPRSRTVYSTRAGRQGSPEVDHGCNAVPGGGWLGRTGALRADGPTQSDYPASSRRVMADGVREHPRGRHRDPRYPPPLTRPVVRSSPCPP